MDAAEEPAEDHHLRVEDVDEAGQPEAQPAPDGVERLEHVGRAGGGLAEDGLDLLAAGVRGMAGAAQERALAHLGLPAADRAAAARAPLGVDRHVPDLAGEPARAGERLAVDDQAPADPDLAGEEQDVLRADGGAPAQLGQRAEVGLVGHGDRQRRPERVGQALGQRHVAPAEVRRHRDDAGVAAHDADHPDADADHAVGVGQATQHRAREGGEVGDGLVDRAPVARPIQAHDVEDLAADRNGGDGQRVDGDLQGQDDAAARAGPDERRRTSGRALGGAALLGDEAGEGQLADEAANRAAGQSRARSEL